ncbi:hypothetical protein T484DRAFT_1833245 [Baffinella frigidus]|nr:hypothetical protein T484DRAFT_1833245 [Cryptophyta sp. CCMP2293]
MSKPFDDYIGRTRRTVSNAMARKLHDPKRVTELPPPQEEIFQECQGNCGTEIGKREAASHCFGPGCQYMEGYCVTCKADCGGWKEELACDNDSCPTSSFFCTRECIIAAGSSIEFYTCPKFCAFCSDCAKKSNNECHEPSCKNGGRQIKCPICGSEFCPTCLEL